MAYVFHLKNAKRPSSKFYKEKFYKLAPLTSTWEEIFFDVSDFEI